MGWVPGHHHSCVARPRPSPPRLVSSLSIAPTPEQLGAVEILEDGWRPPDELARRSHTSPVNLARHLRLDNQEHGDDSELEEETDIAMSEGSIDDQGLDENYDGVEVDDAEVDGEEADEGNETQDDVLFDPAAVGLKEISNLASFTVSSYKPGCGVKELRDDDVHQYWQ